MNNLNKISKIKKQPYIKDYTIASCRHCPMDIAIEELQHITDTNVLVIGVGECVFYSKKINLGTGRHNWAFDLSDNELVFGDTSEISKAIRDISDNNLFTICILTCIPSIINLNLQYDIAQMANTILLPAAHYANISEYDIIPQLYLQIAQKKDITPNNGICVWEDEICTTQDFYSKLCASTQIVNNNKYLKAVRYICDKHNLTIIDNTSFQKIEYYKKYKDLLCISEQDIQYVTSTTKRILSTPRSMSIKCAYAYDLATFFSYFDAQIDTLILPEWTNEIKEKCLKISKDLMLGFDYSIDINNSDLNIDLSNFDDQIKEFVGFEKLKFMIRKVEDICH